MECTEEITFCTEFLIHSVQYILSTHFILIFIKLLQSIGIIGIFAG